MIFMKATRMTKIRFESRESRFIRYGIETTSFCRGCTTETRHLRVAQMAALLAVSEKTIFRLAESKTLHSAETPEGWLMICTKCAASLGQPVDGVTVLEIGDKLL
jgi:hypothetical protein